MNDTFEVIPVPDDLSKIIAFHDGTHWIRGIIAGTLALHDGYIQCDVRWTNGQVRRYRLAVEEVRGYLEVK